MAAVDLFAIESVGRFLAPGLLPATESSVVVQVVSDLSKCRRQQT